jgi:rhamnosyltransferase subunit B
MSHCFLISVGSDGDVFPLLSIGRELVKRGHEATLLAACIYKEEAVCAGLAFIPLSDRETYDLRVRDTYLLTTTCFSAFQERYAIPWNEVIYKNISCSIANDKVIIAVEHLSLWADIWLHESLQIPVIRVRIEPPSPFNVRGSSSLMPVGPTRLARTASAQAAWLKCAEACNFLASMARFVELKRALPRIGLWADWFTGGPLQNTSTTACGFIIPRPPIKAIEVPLFGDGKDIVIFIAGTRGTTIAWSHEFFTVSARICRELDCRGVLLAGDKPLLNPGERDFVHWFPFASLRLLLSSARAVVHHGGIGTAVIALERGVPQLVIPRVFGQFGNAEWLRRLGVAMNLSAEHYSVRGEAVLLGVMTDSAFRRNSVEFGRRLDSDGAVGSACNCIERHSRTLDPLSGN